jgi:hypothetical protein
MKAKNVLCIVLLFLFAVSLPIGFAARDIGKVIFNREKASGLVMTNVLSVEALSGIIKQTLREETRFKDDGPPMKSRLLIVLSSTIRENEWAELIELVLPEKSRADLGNQVVSSVFDWLDSDRAYPDLVLYPEQYTASIEKNAGKIVPWLWDALMAKPCPEDQAARYEKGDFGEDLPALMKCRPPEGFRDEVISHAADLIRNRIQSKIPPEKIILAKKFPVGKEEILTRKEKINRLRSYLPFGWVLPILFFIAALALVVRKQAELTTWTGWPLFAGGALGVWLALYLMAPSSLLEQVLGNARTDVPLPVFSLGKNLCSDLLNQAGGMLLNQMIVPLVIGGALLVIFYRIRFKNLLFKKRS